MKATAPIHIRKFCYEDNTDKTYCELQEEYQDEYTFVRGICVHWN